MHPCQQGGPNQNRPQDGGCDRGPGGGGPEIDEEPDHLEHTAHQWEKAFWQALHEVRVEIMKEKIKAAWGENMAATASGVLLAFDAEWKEFQAKQAAEEKEAALGDAIKAAVKEGLKKGPQ